jgi:hypothetical protein
MEYTPLNSLSDAELIQRVDNISNPTHAEMELLTRFVSGAPEIDRYYQIYHALSDVGFNIEEEGAAQRMADIVGSYLAKH